MRELLFAVVVAAIALIYIGSETPSEPPPVANAAPAAYASDDPY
jgi:hypothetical protein